jgi:hypothetical protein
VFCLSGIKSTAIIYVFVFLEFLYVLLAGICQLFHAVKSGCGSLLG